MARLEDELTLDESFGCFERAGQKLAGLLQAGGCRPPYASNN
ncbi:MAG: hypothetical protein H6661_00465 [Ardenticatenaceae bacterium]|nr:hypothetical protein [Ardenticatenaceae bacterium]